jgi:uronate dehydrogenase
VVFASSNHAVGFVSRSEFPVPGYRFPAPDTCYGVSKAATEALAALYYYRYGIHGICVRVLSCAPAPYDLRSLSTWLSPYDAGRLFGACLTVDRPGYRVVFGVSANTRGGRVPLDEAKAIGYRPQDGAEPYAERIIAGYGGHDPYEYMGGDFTSPDLDAPLP